MSGVGHLPTEALRIVLEHHRPDVLRRQLSDIDEFIREYWGGVPPHYDRMRRRAHALHSIEYCEDVIMHLKFASDMAFRMSDADSAALRNQVIFSCVDVQHGEAGDADNAERRRAAMWRVLGLLDIFVNPSQLRPWAREHLDLHRLAKWYERRHEGYEPTLAEFRELQAVLSPPYG